MGLRFLIRPDGALITCLVTFGPRTTSVWMVRQGLAISRQIITFCGGSTLLYAPVVAHHVLVPFLSNSSPFDGQCVWIDPIY